MRIVELVMGQSARLYALRDTSADDHMLTKFFKTEDIKACDASQAEKCRPFNPRCSRRCNRARHLAELHEFAYRVGPRRGFLDRGHEGSFARAKVYKYPFGALASGPFRVYGLLLGHPDRPLFLAGGGGIKLVPKLQDDPKLKACFVLMQQVLPAIRKGYKEIGSGIEEAFGGVLRFPPALLELDLEIS